MKTFDYDPETSGQSIYEIDQKLAIVHEKKFKLVEHFHQHYAFYDAEEKKLREEREAIVVARTAEHRDIVPTKRR